MFYQLHDKDQTPNEDFSFIFLAYPSLSAAHLSRTSCLSFFCGAQIIEHTEKNIDVSFLIPLPSPNFFLYICSHLYVHIQVVFFKNINGILAAYLLTTSCHLLFLELFMLFHPYVTRQKPPLSFPPAPVRPAVTAFNYLMFF